MQTVLDAAFHLAHDAPGGATALAARLGKNPGTLCHELTATGSAKLGLTDSVKLTLLTGDRRILNAFAAACGCLVLPMPDHTAGIDTYAQLADTAREFGEFVASVADGARDGRVTANELARVQRECAELVVAAQDVCARLAQIHEAGKPVHLRKAA
jgi:hypothetical protein